MEGGGGRGTGEGEGEGNEWQKNVGWTEKIIYWWLNELILKLRKKIKSIYSKNIGHLGETGIGMVGI